ncbi:MAG: glycosyltransferase family 4 protein [Anaerolineae bacterium]|jgi:glycosyltransferase involved in cell wall biosynthesis|nr:glycosyltransferase family 4 protein [Anaerolineae bacterium]MBT7188769.1 glycosyltransferase family 4 protein [Anaerolineae bacterium]MBT7600568.1 glycosyltransferase family 4 protein [Anaerolineae bacterium]MBT7988750.1 glycosyltransferase family 4 protein [Anaerolineae bacterium]
MTDQPYRLLLVTKSTGGIAEYVRWLVKGLDQRKFEITVVCLSENSITFADELGQVPNVKAISYEMNRYKVSLFSDARLGFRLTKLIRSGQFDLIHAHGSKPGFLVRVAALGTRLPVIYTPHAFAFHAGRKGVAKSIIIFLESVAARFTTRFLTVSAGGRDLAIEHGVGKRTQFVVVNTGIDAEVYRQPVDIPALKAELGIPVDAPVVGSVGRLSEQKSPLDFVRVAEASLKFKPDACFVWAGSGPLEAEARKLSAQLGVESSIYWLGQRSDIPQLLHIFDCFLLTSYWEGFPLVVLEAMAAGVPVVATDISGTRESVLHGENGWLAPAGDHKALAGFVLGLLNDPKQASAFVQKSYERIDSEFTQEKMFRDIQQVYISLLSPTEENGYR